MIALGLLCSAQAFSSCPDGGRGGGAGTGSSLVAVIRGDPLVAVHRLLLVMPSLFAEYRLQALGLQ